VLITASSGFNAAAVYRFRHAPPGQTFLVKWARNGASTAAGGGSAGIILDAGLGNDGLIWGGVQPALAKTTRVCSYDRAGLRLERYAALRAMPTIIAPNCMGCWPAANITGPVVLMGHSIAGMYIRDYATRYPENIAD